MKYNQQEFDIRLEWGLKGVEELAPISDVIIIVDILSFSTCVDIATRNGAIIYPYRWKDESATEYAKTIGAELADFNRKYTDAFSLSPTSLLKISSATKLILPSPNGSTLTLSTGTTPTLCGSLRNAKSVANFAKKYGNKISIIPAGEQWADKSLRVAFEDLVGAGAIISYLTGSLSPESKTALTIFENSKTNLTEEIKKCSSGKELIARGFNKDILLACELNISYNVPILIDNAYVGGV
ncbi:MAG TPA: 2-phosphosulfolactate phosphatase [Flavobacterium sp.]|jgi:2-phosphosulfolactate phosphatase